MITAITLYIFTKLTEKDNGGTLEPVALFLSIVSIATDIFVCLLVLKNLIK